MDVRVHWLLAANQPWPQPPMVLQGEDFDDDQHLCTDQHLDCARPPPQPIPTVLLSRSVRTRSHLRLEPHTAMQTLCWTLLTATFLASSRYGSINFMTPGTYHVTYTCTNSRHFAAVSKTRVVVERTRRKLQCCVPSRLALALLCVLVVRCKCLMLWTLMAASNTHAVCYRAVMWHAPPRNISSCSNDVPNRLLAR